MIAAVARRLPALLSAAALLLMQPWAAAQSQDIVLHDDRGRMHRFTQPPRRIVTLLPSHTETVWALGAADRLVGTDRHSNWPPDVDRLPRLGGLDDVHLETIVKLRPDVVVASTASRALDRLDALGIPVLRLKSDTHADLRRTLQVLSTMLGTPSAGERAWSRIEGEIAAAGARVPAPWRGRQVYFEIGSGPYAAGPTSFIGETLARLGLRNIVPPALGPFPKLNPEFIVRARPDVLMGVEREMAEVASRPGWVEMPAVSQRRWCGFTPTQYDTLVRPGPRLGEAASLLAACLQRVGGA